jgi:pimeloyl-ACP methyl ester carboxylesterase
LELEQTIKFCLAPDGVRIAYAVAGDGPPNVRVGSWFTHLEFDWDAPLLRHMLEGLAEHRQLVRYDVRGTGLSQREVGDITFDHFVSDLGTVVDAAGLKRFPLLASSQGGAVGVTYAVRNPERVSHLILLGAFARGAAYRPNQGLQFMEALRAIIRQGWGSDDPSYRQLFSSQFIPEGTPEQLQWFSERQRQSATPEIAEKIYVATQTVDVRPLLSQIKVPTLILHCRGDRRVPIEMGQELAAGIAGARFVALESNNHMILEHEPAAEVFVNEVADFLGDPRPKAWKRRARVREARLQTIAQKVETSTTYRVIVIVGVLATVISFAIWLIT